MGAVKRRKRIKANEHLGLVYQIAKGYLRPGLELDELAAEGTIGLMRAAKKFDPTRGVKFSTYAVWWIRSKIERALIEKGRLVRLPVKLARQARRNGTTPPRPMSFDQTLAEGCTLHDVLADESAERPDDGAKRLELRRQINEAINGLRMTPTERAVLRMKYTEELTLEEIGDRFGVCRERIRQILAEVLTALLPRLAPYVS